MVAGYRHSLKGSQIPHFAHLGTTRNTTSENDSCLNICLRYQHDWGVDKEEKGHGEEGMLELEALR